MSKYTTDISNGTRSHGKAQATTSGVLLANSSPSRHAIEFYNEGSNVVYLYNANNASDAVTYGRILAADGGTYTDASSGTEWWGFTSSGTSNVRTVTVLTTMDRGTRNLG